MKKFKAVSLYISLFLGALYVGEWLEDSFALISDSVIKNELTYNIITKTIICAIFLFIGKRLKLMKFNGLTKEAFKFYPIFQVLALYTLVYTIKAHTFQIESVVLFLFFVSTLCTGFAEELCFRGVLLPTVIKSFSDSENVILKSVVIVALIFGVLHFGNLIKYPENILGVTTQVIAAICVSFLFSAILLKSRSIVVAGITHGLINFTFSGRFLSESQKNTGDITMNLNSVVTTSIFFGIILIISIVMIKKVNRQSVLNSL